LYNCQYGIHLQVKDQSKQGIFYFDYDNITNITIKRVTIDNIVQNGVALSRVNGYHIDNCTISNCGNVGIGITGDDNYPTTNGTIRDCVIHDITGNDAISLHRRGAGYLEQNGPNHFIYNCTGYNCNEEAFDITSGKNILLRECEAYNNGQASLMTSHNVSNFFIDNLYSHDDNYGISIVWVNNLTVRNSIIYNWTNNGLNLNDGGNATKISNNIYVIHNTFVYKNDKNFIQHDKYAENVISKNNIFHSVNTYSPDLFLDYKNNRNVSNTNSNYSTNIWWRGDGGTAYDAWWNDDAKSVFYNISEWNALPDVSNELRLDPKLKNPANGDFTLKSDSPAIDAGTNLTFTSYSGSGKNIMVDDAHYFHDGFGLAKGDEINVGSNKVRIIDIYYKNNTVIVDQLISWNKGDSVNLAYLGSAQDIGAIEFYSIGPKITNTAHSTSDPMDTNSSFGWINITTTVTSDCGIDSVFVNITKPDGSLIDLSMNAIGLNSYYLNSSTLLSNHGDYTYYITAKDLNGNMSKSANYDFLMPPNWDINKDRKCNILDLILISNHFNETGTNGWIREDVDNNGNIQVLDLALVALHYYELW
jgi:hypothetical protein